MLIPRLFPSLHRFLAPPLSYTSLGGPVDLRSLPCINPSQVLNHWIVVSPRFVVIVQNASLEGIQHSRHSLQ